jgi:hypothetical protein
MSPTSYIVAPLLATALVACSPRYQIQPGFDPITGTQTTIRLDTKTGATTILKSRNAYKTYSVYSWEEIYESDVAQRIVTGWIKAAQKDPNLTNSEIIIK